MRSQTWLFLESTLGEQIGAVPVFMSGTCAGAFFAASLGFPALAIGYQMNKGMFHDHQTPLEVDLHDYPGLVLEKIIGKALEHGIEPFTFWNINFPANPTSEIVVAELEHWGYWDERIDIFDDSRFEINGDQKPDGHEKGTDAYYFSKGKIVLTPIRVNMTDPMGFEKVKKIDFS